MSLPPLVPAPPPAAAPRSQLRKQQQQQQQQQRQSPPPPPPPPPAPRKAAACAPAKPPRKGRGGPSERSGPFSSSWPSTSLQKQQLLPPRSRAAQGSGTRAAPAASGLLSPSPARGGCWALAPPGSGWPSCESLCPAAGGRGEAALRFSLSLPPEAIRVLQRRSLEKERRQPARPPRRHASPDPAKPPAAATGSGGGGGDWRALLKVSLLNERHRYDDVEYEEEAPDGSGAWEADEGLVRKCTEWLRGVESAVARDQGSKLETLPHLSTL